MANITIDRKEIEKYIKLNDETVERISMMGVPSELSGDSLNLEILPNRPDLLSMQGFLRAFKAFIGKEPGLKRYKIEKSDAKIFVDKAVDKVRPYSMAAIVKGVKFDDEVIKQIMQWQEKIHSTIGRNRRKVALGYYMLNKIKFPVKFITKKPKDIIFEPLDMPEKMSAVQILSRHPCGREFGKQLEGFEEFPVYYDANGEVLSLPPIINSNNSGKILPGTTDVLIECSGTDIETLKKVITIACVDLIDLGGKAYSVEVVYGNKKESIDFSSQKMGVSLENVNKLIGLQLKEKDLEKLLPKMGYDYSNGKVSVPAWRTDVIHEVDIIEDIAIAYGIDKLVPEIPEVATIGAESIESRVESKIAEILAGLGLIEISSYHLVKADEAKDVKDKIEVLDSKTDYKILRPNLSIPAFRILSENKDNEYPQRIFEIGRVFEYDKGGKSETGVIEKEKLIVALTPGGFTEIKQVMEYLFRMINIECKLSESKNDLLIDGRAGNISVNGKVVGFIGETNVETLRSWNIKMPVALTEIDLGEIFKLLR